MSKTPEEAPVEGVKIKLGQVIDLAKQGRQDILPTLRQALTKHPELWQHYGNLASQAQAQWRHLVAGNDLYLQECLDRHCAALRASIAGPESTPLEQLQADRIVALNLVVGYYEAQIAAHEGQAPDRVLEYLHERHGVADRRLQDAIINLARIRRLLPGTLQVNVVVSGEVQATLKDAEKAQSTTPTSRAPITVPRHRVADLLAAAKN